MNVLHKMTLAVCVCVLCAHSATYAQTIGLQQLIESSLTHSNQIAIRNTEVQQASINRRMAMSAYLPQLSLNATYTLLNDDVRLGDDLETLLMGTQALLIKEKVGIPFNTSLSDVPMNIPLKDVPPVQEREIFKVSADAQMILFSGFKVPCLLRAASHQELAASYMSAQTGTTTIKEVVAAYDKLAVVHESEVVLRATDNYLTTQENFVNKAIANGLATEIDRQQVELARIELETKKVELEANKHLLLSKLSQLSKYPVQELQDINPVLEVLVTNDTYTNVSNRKDIKALDEAILATDYKRKSELTDYVPKIAIVGHKEFIKDDLSAFDPEWYVGVGVKFNVFDRFDAHHRAQKVKLDRIVLENKREEAEDLLLLNLEKTQSETDKCNKLVVLARQRVAVAERTHELSAKEFECGLRTSADHLKVTNDLQRARLDLINAIYDQRQAAINYLDASGSLSADSVL